MKFMLCLNRNLYCNVVINVQVLLHMLKIRIVLKWTRYQQYVFMSIDWYHYVNCTEDKNLKKDKHINYVRYFQQQQQRKIVHRNRNCFNGDINWKISWKVLIYSHKKYYISFTTCVLESISRFDGLSVW